MKKCVSILLALVIVLGCIGWRPAQAVDRENATSTPSTHQTADPEAQKPVDPALQAELMRQCEDSGIFRYIDKDKFCQSAHIARLTEEETLNTYVFQNQDGTKSVYYMETNVKYIAPDGSIRDKDITLVPVTGGYSMRDNDVELLLPNQATDGIAVSHNGNSVRLIPQGGDGAAVLSDNSIIYSDFYGRRTALRYTPALSGVKEEIILAAYTGMNSFSFLLQTGGLVLYENEGQYYLAENENAEAAFYLGQIIVYDAVGCPSMGSMTVETLISGQTYRLTVSADVEFLTAPTTVYPVTIDPTITITDSTVGGAIEDAPVFSGYPNTNFGNYVFNTIGYTDENYGIGRTVVRLSGLLENATFAALDKENINRVEFYMKDGGSSSAGVNIHALTVNSTWTESTVKWSNVGLHTEQVYASATMGGGRWTAFDITTLAKQWKSGQRNGQCGFVMIAAEEETKKIGALSCEYGTGDYWPYVVVTYSLDMMLNYYSRDLYEGNTVRLMANNSMGTLAAVTWNSSAPSVATVSGGGLVTAVNAGTTIITATDAEGNTASCTICVRIRDGLYYIKNTSSGLYLQNRSNAARTFAKITDQTLRLPQLWKITYIGSGYYAIRPIQDFSMALCVNPGGSVVVDDEAVNDANISSSAKWTIQHNSFGYAFKQGGLDAKTMTPIGTFSNSAVNSRAWSASAISHWELEEAYGIFLRDTITLETISPSTVKYIELDDSATLADLEILYECYGSLTGSVTWFSSDTSVATVSASGKVTGADGGQVVITMQARVNDLSCFASYSLKVNSNDAIIIIPGIMGTELIAGENNSTYEPNTLLWPIAIGEEPNLVEITAALNALACNADGTSVDDVIVNVEGSPYGVNDIYMDLFLELQIRYQGEYTIEFFGYDWRLSNATSAEKLDEFISQNEYDSVVLVCHSMGGLVASSYLAQGPMQREIVDSVIMIGTPLLGTPVMPYVFGSEDLGVLGLYDMLDFPEDFLDIITAIGNPFASILCNFASIYELFPPEQYFNSVYVNKRYLMVWEQGFDYLEMTTYDNTRMILNTKMDMYNVSLANAAEAFHDSLYSSSTHIACLENTYYIAGYGIDTINKVMVTETIWGSGEATQYGDSMVATWSATLGDYNTGRTFYVYEVDHEDLIDDYEVIQFVISLVDENTSTSPYEKIFDDIVWPEGVNMDA